MLSFWTVAGSSFLGSAAASLLLLGCVCWILRVMVLKHHRALLIYGLLIFTLCSFVNLLLTLSWSGLLLFERADDITVLVIRSVGDMFLVVGLVVYTLIVAKSAAEFSAVMTWNWRRIQRFVVSTVISLGMINLFVIAVIILTVLLQAYSPATVTWLNQDILDTFILVYAISQSCLFVFACVTDWTIRWKIISTLNQILKGSSALMQVIQYISTQNRG